MAAMMPASGTHTPYDDDALENDLIDPDDGMQFPKHINHSDSPY